MPKFTLSVNIQFTDRISLQACIITITDESVISVEYKFSDN